VLAINPGYLPFGHSAVAAALLSRAFALALTIRAAEHLDRAAERPGKAQLELTQRDGVGPIWSNATMI
jgi:hypothetical protein